MIEQYFSTFKTNKGSIDDQIKKATGLAGKAALLGKMDEKPYTQARDILIQTPCNQNCQTCFFKEFGSDYVKLNDETIQELRIMANALGQTDPELLTVYMREPTTALPILRIFAEQKTTRTLTNARILNQPGVIETLEKNGIKKLIITVPGKKEAYATYTGNDPNEYPILLSNIQLALNKKFDVSVFMPIFSQNINDVESTVYTLGNMGIKKIQFIRVRPLGDAYNLPDNFFTNQEDIVKFLESVNRARITVGNKMNLSMLGTSFGPNFFGTSEYKQLAGITNKWPKSKYLCPMVNRQFVGVSLGSKIAYSCFMGLSFEESKIGYYKDGKIIYNQPSLTTNELSTGLRGNCSDSSCQYQALCMGGCRIAAFAVAKRNNEENPMLAGQDICITNILQNL